MNITRGSFTAMVLTQSLAWAEPVITQPPTDLVAYLELPATLEVVATGTSSLSYQWWRDGETMEGRTESVLTFDGLSYKNAGNYSVVVSDRTGSVTNPPVRLTVLPHDVVAGRDWELQLGTPVQLEWETSNEDGNPNVVSDGLTLIFSSKRPGGRGGWDLWTATRSSTADPWGSPVNLGPGINSARDEDNSRLSADSLTLYFDSTRTGGHGAHDLWMTTRTSRTASFGPPINLGANINAASDDGSPAISADGLTLIFASDRPGLGGPGDLWISTRTNAAAAWEPAQLMPAPVNSPTIEATPALSADSLTLIFMSTRAGQGALWISRRANRTAEFEPPLLIQHLLDTVMSCDYPSLSADSSALYFNTYPFGFSDGTPQLWQTSLTPLPRITIGSTAVTAPKLRVLLQGRPYGRYDVESSTDLESWTYELTIRSEDAATVTPFEVLPPGGQRLFLRAGLRN